MAKWFGVIGFSNLHEDEDNPGVWIEGEMREQQYYGELTSDYRKRHTKSDGINDDIDLTNMISIVADPYAFDNCSNMRYATIRGTKWKITNIEVQYPRLNLSVGGVYNG